MKEDMIPFYMVTNNSFKTKAVKQISLETALILVSLLPRLPSGEASSIAFTAFDVNDVKEPQVMYLAVYVRACDCVSVFLSSVCICISKNERFKPLLTHQFKLSSLLLTSKAERILFTNLEGFIE